MKKLSVYFFILSFYFPILGFARIDFDKPGIRRDFLGEKNTDSSNENVVWVGKVRDEISTHDTSHEHELRFIRQSDGKSFDIESSELKKLHHETDKNFLVEINAEKTPRFLFWGGNLIVKSYKILESIDGSPHQPDVELQKRRPSFMDRERFRGRI